MIKPRKLHPGDRIAAVTPSWGGPGAMPWVYELGKRQIEASLGVEVLEMPHTLRDPQWIYQNPKARAHDLMQAFADPSINAIFSAIGGDDSVRLLPYLDLELMQKHPKIFLGFSDSTTIHLACYKAGICSYYGPSIMIEMAEVGGILPYTLTSLKRTLFSSDPIGKTRASMAGWTGDFPEWPLEPHDRKRALQPPVAWKTPQGSGVASGHLLGGCFEALEFVKGTDFWPSPDKWNGAILFLETYDAPSTTYVEHWLRNYGSQGILQRVSGILFGRPGGSHNNSQSFDRYDAALLKVLREFGLESLPVLTRMDFGHTDPKFILPYGVRAEIHCDDASIVIPDGAVID